MTSVPTIQRLRSRPATKPGERCPDCRGEGAIYLHAEGWDGTHPVQAEYTCGRCDGRGWLSRSAARTNGRAA